MGMHEAIDVPHVPGSFLRHVAIGALCGFCRVVKRARALPRNSAGLPVVILVEAAGPAITVHRNIEMNFVARRAELRSLLAHERFEKDPPVRLGIQFDQEVMQSSRYRILRRCQLM